MPAPRLNQAAWEKAAENLAADLRVAAVDYQAQSVEQLSDASGMATTVILDSLFRPPVTDPDNPRTYVCRPAYRIDSTPYWSPDQVAKATEAMRRRNEGTGHGPALPMVDDDNADVVSIRDIFELTGVHEQTVRKWANGSYVSREAGPFPEPVGRRRPVMHRGNPATVYPRAATLAWVQAAGFELIEPGTATEAPDGEREPEPVG